MHSTIPSVLCSAAEKELAETLARWHWQSPRAARAAQIQLRQSSSCVSTSFSVVVVAANASTEAEAMVGTDRALMAEALPETSTAEALRLERVLAAVSAWAVVDRASALRSAKVENLHCCPAIVAYIFLHRGFFIVLSFNQKT